jgi:UPF0716 protein FxsA
VALVLFFIFIVVPIVELYVIVQVADVIGVLETIALLIVVAILGSWLLKRQGMAAWSRFRLAMAEGRVPTEEITDGMMIMFGGALLLTPGFVSDALGFVLLFPPTRAVVKAASRRTIKRWVLRRTGTSGIYAARVIRVERDAKKSERPPGSAPSDKHPAALEDDSPDKG